MRWSINMPKEGGVPVLVAPAHLRGDGVPVSRLVSDLGVMRSHKPRAQRTLMTLYLALPVVGGPARSAGSTASESGNGHQDRPIAPDAKIRAVQRACSRLKYWVAWLACVLVAGMPRVAQGRPMATELIYSFDNSTVSQFPSFDLILASDGFFYGTVEFRTTWPAHRLTLGNATGRGGSRIGHTHA